MRLAYQLRRGPPWLRRAWLVTSLVGMLAFVPVLFLVYLALDLVAFVRDFASSFRELRQAVRDDWRACGEPPRRPR